MDTLLHQPKIWLTDKEQREIKDQQCHLPKKCVCYQGIFSDQLYALLGCDTTSWLFGIGKAAVLKKFRTNKALQETAKVFDSVSASAEEIQLAGEKTLAIMYNGNSRKSIRWSVVPVAPM